ncbi:hypothetical protein M407DRAFT_7323 [Tulasnella calospora MUT 4182]|uniref:Uncharacterized protein n=1 Tax=Tulasnella calospora MUT 4182 TaxID=1051891 RepID=A0A0C3M139_9AGAM|nr:hypothetical protein M407DRAFT_7323 [Tulasnella calospora MUT 4182]
MKLSLVLIAIAGTFSQASAAGVPVYGQCGGTGYTGPVTRNGILALDQIIAYQRLDGIKHWHFNPRNVVAKEIFGATRRTYSDIIGNDTYFPVEIGLPSAFFYNDKDTGNIYHTYSTDARGLDVLLDTLPEPDFTPKGRDEEQFGRNKMAWVKRYDEYEAKEIVKPTPRAPLEIPWAGTR